MNENFKHEDVTEIVIRSFFKVYNTLGYGFLERVYENALFYELSNTELIVEKQSRINVLYKGEVVGKYVADLVINEKVIIEIKAGEHLCEEHECQLINYLKATNIEVGLLLNFGKKPQFRRKVFSNKYY